MWGCMGVAVSVGVGVNVTAATGVQPFSGPCILMFCIEKPKIWQRGSRIRCSIWKEFKVYTHTHIHTYTHTYTYTYTCSQRPHRGHPRSAGAGQHWVPFSARARSAL